MRSPVILDDAVLRGIEEDFLFLEVRLLPLFLRRGRAAFVRSRWRQLRYCRCGGCGHDRERHQSHAHGRSPLTGFRYAEALFEPDAQRRTGASCITSAASASSVSSACACAHNERRVLARFRRVALRHDVGLLVRRHRGLLYVGLSVVFNWVAHRGMHSYLHRCPLRRRSDGNSDRRTATAAEGRCPESAKRRRSRRPVVLRSPASGSARRAVRSFQR